MSDAAQHDAFSLLAPGLQRALWDMSWRDLRPIQREAILAWNGAGVLGAPSTPAGKGPRAAPDLLIMAQTAGGKTEAAFLPVLSQIAPEPEGSVRAIYVGPLKALINDQFERVELLCRHMDLPVHRWHGDVGDASKSALVEAPGGVLLITPESLESLLVNRTPRLGGLFGGLRAIVIDEVHSFLESERGRHLSSLLSRVGRYVAGGTRPRRVGLSATIGDPKAAAEYLCPEDPGSVVMIRGAGEAKELRLRVHWYAAGPDAANPPDPAPTVATGGDTTRAEGADPVIASIAGDLVTHMHAWTNLVFANAKGRIEVLGDAANRVCRERALDERFHVHHGSLSRAIREDVEREMKDAPPDTAICSSTLEMGIDIGAVRTVGQVGPPWSVASLKQRLGRSGRRDGEPRRLRVYLGDDADPDADQPEKRLPLDLIQTVAVLELMLTDAWVEPPERARLDLSTLAHQAIALVAETGGIRADDLSLRLCGPGAFSSVTPRLLGALLRSLGSRDVLEQTPRGELILGLEGERIRASREFYAVFLTPREFTVRAGDAAIGSLPITVAPREGDSLALGGRAWEVQRVDMDRLEIAVIPAHRARAPMFSGSPGRVHPRVREKMLEVVRRGVVGAGPAYLDAGGLSALARAGATARAQGLDRRRLVQSSPTAGAIMTWSGTRAQETVAAVLRSGGVPGVAREVSVSFRASEEGARRVLGDWAGAGDAGALRLARCIEPRLLRKYDHLLDEALLDEAIAADRLDIEGARRIVTEALRTPQP